LLLQLQISPLSLRIIVVYYRRGVLLCRHGSVRLDSLPESTLQLPQLHLLLSFFLLAHLLCPLDSSLLESSLALDEIFFLLFLLIRFSLLPLTPFFFFPLLNAFFQLVSFVGYVAF